MTSPGAGLNGRYRLEERLGGGGMGSVWKAFDKHLERTVAVKELISGRHGPEDLAIRRERVRREALALAKVEHPAVVSIHDLITVGADRAPWIVMGYVRGDPLDRIIREQPPLDEQKVASIGLAVLLGLMACHHRGVYHRDVKPANIVVSGDGSVRLVDFGIARIVGKDPLTEESKVLGTPGFLAPELLHDQQSGSGTDLWALGVTLYCALEDREPFHAESVGAVMMAILDRKPPQPRTGGPLAALVLRMLMKKPADRPDAAMVATSLRAIASAGGPASPPYWLGPDQRAGDRQHGAWDWPRAAAGREDVPRQEPPGTARRDAQPARPGRRLTALTGMPAFNAARLIATWTPGQAAAELLAIDSNEAAKDINLCSDQVGGAALSAIAVEAGEPALARKILEMVALDRAGRLLDHMSSAAAAAALALPTAAVAVRRLAEADDSTVVGVLTEMNPRAAASLVREMNSSRAAEVLGRMPDPVPVAGILLHVAPATGRQSLLSRLSPSFRALVTKHMERISGTDTAPGA